MLNIKFTYNQYMNNTYLFISYMFMNFVSFTGGNERVSNCYAHLLIYFLSKYLTLIKRSYDTTKYMFWVARYLD